MKSNNINLSKLSTSFFLEIGIVVTALIFMIVPLLSHAATLDRELQVGMSGSDVSALQTFLAQDSTIYPQGLVTGYFGPLTFSAVSNFQSRNGIATVGRVGPITLSAINAQISGGMSGGGADVYAPNIYNVNLNKNGNTVTVSWSTSESAKGVVYYSTNPLITYEYPHSVDISGNTAMTDTSFRNSQNVYISGLQANTTYFYSIYVTDASGNVSMTLPATFQSN